MSEYKHLDDIDHREHQDMVFQWYVVAALFLAVVVVGFEILQGF
jgi:hypothetical protein